MKNKDNKKEKEIPKFFPIDEDIKEITTLETKNNKKEQVIKKIPKISDHWIDDKKKKLFVPFFPKDNQNSKESIEIVKLLNEAFSQLLTEEYHVFWSFIINEKSIWLSIDSYLRYKSRSYESNYQPLKEKEPQALLFERIFKAILRISTNTEDKENFMTLPYYNNFLKESKLFSIPMLFDLSVLYSNANARAVKDMIAYQFKINQNNWEQLAKVIPNFKKILNKLNSDCKLKKDDKNLQEEAHVYLLDFLASISCFLDMFPRASTVFQKANQFVDLLVNIYTNWIPTCPLKDKTGMMQRLVVKLFNDLLEECYFNSVYNFSNEFNPQSAQHFLNVLEKMDQTMYGEDSLLITYHKKYNLKKKIDTFFSKGNHLKGKIDHIYNIISLYSAEKNPVVVVTQKKQKVQESSKEDEMIHQVRSLFPKLGDGFIYECLKFYKFNSETVIDSLLNENLDLSLENLNRNMPRSKSKFNSSSAFDGGKEDIDEETSEDVSSLSLSTSNLYDQLELNGTNMIAHKGKKQTESFFDLLNDKSQIKWVKKYADNYDDDYDEIGTDGDGVNEQYSIDPSETDESDDESDDDVNPNAPIQEGSNDPNDPNKTHNNQSKNQYTRRKKTHNRKNMSSRKKGMY